MSGLSGAGSPEPSTADRMRTTLDLFAAAVDLMRENLRRRHPDASSEDIARLLQEWLDKAEEASSQPARAAAKRRA